MLLLQNESETSLGQETYPYHTFTFLKNFSFTWLLAKILPTYSKVKPPTSNYFWNLKSKPTLFHLYLFLVRWFLYIWQIWTFGRHHENNQNVSFLKIIIIIIRDEMRKGNGTVEFVSSEWFSHFTLLKLELSINCKTLQKKTNIVKQFFFFFITILWNN